MNLSLDQFALATGSSRANAAKYLDHASAAMERFSIVTPVSAAAFCATISVETARLVLMEEDLYYTTAERLADLYKRVFDLDRDGKISEHEVREARGYLRNPKGLSMRLYKGYHGRGGAMLTWERNYAAQTVKLGHDYIGKPELLLQPEHAMLTAASFFDDIKGNAVAHDMGELTRRWNGPRRLHLAERIAQFNAAIKHLG